MAQIRARVWLDQPPHYPESELPELRARPSTGLCLSGGGTRATCAAIGYLRGLLELGLLDRLRYMSSVSGGSWAAVPYSYWQQGSDDDRELLGPILAPEQLDKATLCAELSPRYLGACATKNFRDSVFEKIKSEGIARAWIAGTGETFLEPWGLYHPERPRSYTWSQATLDEIVARQSPLPGQKLGAEDFIVARPDRPFPIVNAVLMGPALGGNHARLEPIGLQFTPLYTGARPRVAADYLYRSGAEVSREVGGGLIESFALDSGGPGYLDDAAVQTVTLERADTLSDLSFMIGSSSCAYASVMTEKVPAPKHMHGRVPVASYWPPRPGDVSKAELWELGDGGTNDNLGLLALLQREVETIIVLVNTARKLSVGWAPGEGSYQDHIDPYIPPLFGVHEERAAITTRHNQVFPSAEFPELVNALQAAKLDDKPVIAVREHEVLDNPWWGIRGGRKVRIAWVYLDRVPGFEARLPKTTAALVQSGNASISAGPFQGFPNYKTIGANNLSLVRLEPDQVRLLANFCTWVVLDQRETFERLLA